MCQDGGRRFERTVHRIRYLLWKRWIVADGTPVTSVGLKSGKESGLGLYLVN